MKNEDIYNIYSKSIEKKSIKISDKEEKELIKKSKLGDVKSTKKLIESNLFLVIFIVKTYFEKYYIKNNKEIFLDLIQEGNIGLIKAIEKFDLEKNIKFSTYAFYWVRQKIIFFIKNQPFRGKPYRYPMYIIDKISKIKKAKKELYEKFNRNPTINEISQFTKEDTKFIKNFIEDSNNEVVSIYFKTETNDNCFLIDLIEDDKNVNNIQMFQKKQVLEIFEKEIFPKLKEKQIEIIKMRFGFYNEITYTLQEIADYLNMTKENVRVQILYILKKIKRNYDSMKKLKEFSQKF